MPEIESSGIETADVVDHTPEVDVASEPVESTDESQVDQPEKSAETGDSDVSTSTASGVKQERAIGPELRKYLDELKVTDPKRATAIRDEYFRGIRLSQKQWYEQFPGGPKEAASLKQFVNEVGGQEGYRTLQENSDAILQLDGMVEGADPKLFDAIQEINPEAFAKLGPQFMDKFSQLAPEVYQATQAKILLNTFSQSGLSNQLYLIKRELARGDAAEAANLVKGIEDWITSVEEVANKKPEEKQPDPREQEFKQREEQFAAQERKVYAEGVASQIIPWRNSEIRKQMTALLKGKQLSEERWNDLGRAVIVRMDAALNPEKNPEIAEAIEAYSEAKDRDGMIKFWKQTMGAKLPNIVKQVHRIWFTDLGGKKPAPTNGNGKSTEKPGVPPQQGVITLSKPPKPEEIDFSKSPFKMRMHSQAILKNGKKVQWSNA